MRECHIRPYGLFANLRSPPQLTSWRCRQFRGQLVPCELLCSEVAFLLTESARGCLVGTQWSRPAFSARRAAVGAMYSVAHHSLTSLVTGPVKCMHPGNLQSGLVTQQA